MAKDKYSKRRWSDHAGMYKYKKALAEGKSKQEARAISQTRGKK